MGKFGIKLLRDNVVSEKGMVDHIFEFYSIPRVDFEDIVDDLLGFLGNFVFAAEPKITFLDPLVCFLATLGLKRRNARQHCKATSYSVLHDDS